MEEFRKGWRLVLAAATGVGLGITGLTFYTLGIFIGPLSQEFGWSRTAISSATLLTTATTMLLGPVVGRLVDRFGGRRVGMLSLFLLAVGLVGLSRIGPSLASFYLAFGVAMVLGAGTLPIVWTRAVNASFDRSRGLALGLTLTGTGVCGILAPPFTQWLIATQGWRVAYLGQAALVAGLGLAVVGLFFRDAAGTARAGRAQLSSGPAGLHLAEARRTRQFWGLGIGLLFASFAVASLIVHLVPMLSGAGIERSTAVWYASVLGIAIIIGRLGVGGLVDRLHPPAVAATVMAAAALGCVLLALPGAGTLLVLPAVLLIGFAAGAEVDLVAFMVSRYFGLRSYGEIYGWQLGFFALGAGLGPMGIGRLYDLTGGYGPGLGACAAGFVVGAVALGTLGPVPKHDGAEAVCPQAG
ncbi:MFS transporter [Nitrospirillum iridis]|uniref:Putative MFS family arabinose efflux permease n=1 Tax=Nitrospirillum iridis TaxID=765888 RepID=A0A7X0B2B6_9PROT|nr:MFS transporter [Nitrospirillum iridis]MBB6253101.1 putative MFS family arabinose efflux permease [Nitrospirillum iridis]